MKVFSESTQRELLALKDAGAPARGILRAVAALLGAEGEVAFASMQAAPRSASRKLTDAERRELDGLMKLAERNELDDVSAARFVALSDCADEARKVAA